MTDARPALQALAGLGSADVIGTERAGFEPAEAFTSLVFKTRAINHSTTPPGAITRTKQAITHKNEFGTPFNPEQQ